MRKWTFLLMGFCVASVVCAAEPTARDSFQAGTKAFTTSNFPAAAQSFLSAAEAATAEKLDPAIAFYNAGLSAYSAGDWKAAEEAFARATAANDLRLQSKAYYNRGNSLFHSGEDSLVGEALQMYENAIALDPQDEDSKANYELAVLKQQEIQQQPKPQPENNEQENSEQSEQQEQQQQDSSESQEQEQQQAEQEQQQAEPKASEEMTPEEAAMMLDAMKAQEQSQRDRLHPFLGRPVAVEKDW